MLKRLIFITITLFWLVMNYLLWQRDFRAADIAGGKVPIDMVWEKMLRSADDSFLFIFNGKNRIGDMRWGTEVLDFTELDTAEEIAAGEAGIELPDDKDEENTVFMTEGMVKFPGSYSVEIRSGRVFLGSPYGQVRFELLAQFTTNNNWISLVVNLRQKRNRLQFAANATNKMVHISYHSGKDNSEPYLLDLTFEQLQDPEQLIAALLGPVPIAGFAGGLLGGLSSPANLKFSPKQLLKLGLHWEARQDWLHIGHSRLRTYRITFFLPDNKNISVYISRSGEIMRILMPNKIELRNARLLLL